MNETTLTPQKHSPATRLFHHGSLILMVILWAMVEFWSEVDGMIGYHKALGVAFLFWVLARVVNLAIRKKVPYPTHPPKWQTALAHLVHFGLYACMLAMPIVGVLMSVYGGRAVNVFGIFQIPVFVKPDREMASFFGNLHTDVVFPLLIALVVAHVAAAIYHQVILKDNLLSRMK